jgi:hypothetical protein
VAAGQVQMDVTLLECPAGDPFINQQLWTFTDELAVELEHRAALEENGLRVGRVVGLPPTELRALLTSPRSCVNPRRRLLTAGHTAPLLLGPVAPEVRFQVCRQGVPAVALLQQAQCVLAVTPALTADGRTQLHFAPRVEYGEFLRELQVAADRSGYTLEVKRKVESYPELDWDVTLAANEYLVIGTYIERPETLGYQAFVETSGAAPLQRLLVIRTGRSGGGIDAEIADLPPADPSLSGGAPPLALQATWTTVRAKGQ